MKIVTALSALALVAGTASTALASPAISSFTGGTGPFDSFFGSVDGDVVGFRFTVAAGPGITVDNVGMWDDILGLTPGILSSH